MQWSSLCRTDFTPSKRSKLHRGGGTPYASLEKSDLPDPAKKPQEREYETATRRPYEQGLLCEARHVHVRGVGSGRRQKEYQCCNQCRADREAKNLAPHCCMIDADSVTCGLLHCG